MQLKYSNYVAFSHFHGKAVNNSGLSTSTVKKTGCTVYWDGYGDFRENMDLYR